MLRALQLSPGAEAEGAAAGSAPPVATASNKKPNQAETTGYQFYAESFEQSEDGVAFVFTDSFRQQSDPEFNSSPN